MRSVIILAILWLMPLAVHAFTYQVGSSRTYPTLQALTMARTLQPDDVVEVDGNATYSGGIIFRDSGTLGHPIIVRGLRVNGLRPIVSGGANGIEFRVSDHMLLEGFEITGSTSRCLYHHAHDITIRDVLVHDCPGNGIQSSDIDSGSLTLEYSEVHHAGQGSLRHMLYIQTDEVAHPGAVFKMRFCYIHHGNGGNMLKSRAERNEISYNWLEGSFYRELELIGPDPPSQNASWTEGMAREDSDVIGNVIVHTSSSALVRTGGDGGGGQTNGRYRFVNNTFVLNNGNSGNTVFQLFDGMESIEMHNNVIYRSLGGAAIVLNEVDVQWAAGSRLIAGSNNWLQTGTAAVPVEWTGTKLGSNPGFVDIVGNDLRPAPASVLIDSANATPSGVQGHLYPNPIFPPVFLPPPRAALGVGAEQTRPISATLDIGAYEAITEIIFQNGFEAAR